MRLQELLSQAKVLTPEQYQELCDTVELDDSYSLFDADSVGLELDGNDYKVCFASQAEKEFQSFVAIGKGTGFALHEKPYCRDGHVFSWMEPGAYVENFDIIAVNRSKGMTYAILYGMGGRWIDEWPLLLPENTAKYVAEVAAIEYDRLEGEERKKE